MTATSAKQPPTISVICPVYNGERYLEETLDSVLAQDFEAFELLVVNDGSTDSTDRIIRQFTEAHPDRIRVLAHPGNRNRGLCASRNLGLRHARGSFYAFIDADDRWRPEKLREQLAVFAANPEVDLVAGTANYWQSWRGGVDRLVRSGHVQNRVIRPPEATLNIYPLKKASSPSPSDWLVRATLVRDIGGFEEVFVGDLALYEDQAFLSKVYLDGNVYFDDRVWIDYRLHEDSLMHQALARGRRDESRKFFFNWFASYLRTRRPRHRFRIQFALQRALFHYRPSWSARSLRRVKRFLNKTVRAAG
jgi:glycosyltransferase involved in cell wall biosynthesis